MNRYSYEKIITEEDWGLLEIKPLQKPKPFLVKIADDDDIKQRKNIIMPHVPEEPKTKLMGRNMNNNRSVLVGFGRL